MDGEDTGKAGVARLRTAIPDTHAFAWIALFLGLNLLYFHLIFDTLNIPSCCDAGHYLKGWKSMLKDGPLFENPYAGYRSIANYAIAGIVETVGSRLRAANGYAAGAVAIYALTGLALIIALSRRQGFAEIFPPLYLNPVAFAYVPYPLQESQMVLLLCPLLVVVHVLLRGGSHRWAATLLWVLAALAWLLKGALLLAAIPLAATAIVVARRTTGGAGATVAGILCLAALLAPQSWVAMQKFGTPYPYPDARHFANQVIWGHSTWRYETALVDGAWTGRYMRTPFAPVRSTGDYLERMRSAPSEIVALWIGHVVGAFDHSELRVYVVDERPAFPVVNVFVGMVIALGLARWIALLRSRAWCTTDAVQDSLLFGSAALLPLLAVETRFSLLAVLALSARTLEWFRHARTNPAAVQEFVLALAFGLVFSLTTTLMNLPA